MCWKLTFQQHKRFCFGFMRLVHVFLKFTLYFLITKFNLITALVFILNFRKYANIGAIWEKNWRSEIIKKESILKYGIYVRKIVGKSKLKECNECNE